MILGSWNKTACSLYSLETRRKIKNFKPVFLFTENFFEIFLIWFKLRFWGLQYDISRNPVRWLFLGTWICVENKTNITRPNYALDRRTILCLYVFWFQRQVFKCVAKCYWVAFTKVTWVPRKNTFKVDFVGSLVLLRIPQRANIGSCSGFRKCKWIPKL